MSNIKQYDDEEIKYSVVEEVVKPEKLEDKEKVESVKEILMEYSKDETTVNPKIVEK